LKRCNDCGISRPLTAYTKQKRQNGTFGYMAICKECHCIVQAKRYQTYTLEQKLQKKSKFLQRKYGITIEQYNEMFNKQNGKCAACNKHQSELVKALVVDHCHISKKVRGLLCPGCNLALGNTHESPERLENLASYIRRTA